MISNFLHESFQKGVFVCQTCADNLYLTRPDKYESGYYRWTKSPRFHVSFGVQTTYPINTALVKKMSFYFETNTNYLYVFSYFGNGNYKSLNPGDIFFFGIGTKVYFNFN